MIPSRSRLCIALCLGLSACAVVGAETEHGSKPDANRLTYLDANDPFYPNSNFPKLTTPQWVGEPGVEAVIILAIDDMREPQKYETFLRPILNRLKQIDGRAPVSIMTCTNDPSASQFQAWLDEGLSLEVHTLTHPCPLLARSDFNAASDVYTRCIELLNRIPSNRPVAFRMPCCDSMNSPSPRFYSEIFNHPNAAGQFLSIDSSVMNLITTNDTVLPHEQMADVAERERRYFPTQTNALTKVSLASFVTTIQDYPYPYVIGKLCWEFPAMLPSDWEAHNVRGPNREETVADWKAVLDVTVLKQGTFTMIFHPHGWIRSDQLVELIDYAVSRYGKKIKFLNFREASERLDQNLLAGHPLRAADGGDNGVRLLDVDNDGYIDVVIGNAKARQMRRWLPEEKRWVETDFPVALVGDDSSGHRHDSGVKFGLLRPDGFASAFYRTKVEKGAWHFDGQHWIADPSFFRGLDVDGLPVVTIEDWRDRGVRLRDVDRDGRCELIVGNERQNAVFGWAEKASRWEKLSYALPKGTAIVTDQGEDAGLRFVDLNGDGYDDVVFSNEQRYSVNVFVPTPRPNVDWKLGWSLEFRAGKRGDAGEIPMIVRGGPHPNNGAWFHDRSLWVQNEDTAELPDKVDRRSFEQLQRDSGPPPKSPEESLAAIHVKPGFTVELVAHEPQTMNPVAFEWGPDGKLWVVEMGDYPLGLDGKGKPGGIVRYLEDTKGNGIYDKSTIFLQGIGFPNGVMPWGKGILVSAAPEIFYAEDTDGDGKADVHQTLLTGFYEGNQQHRVNGFEYGLDNWVYGANGDSGGNVRSLATNKRLDISGRDFRFRPSDGSFELQAGQTQFGRHRDDWGNWFGNENPTWLWHYFVPEQYLSGNPFLAVGATKRVLANYPQPNRIYTISPTMRRFNWPDALNEVTSANSATPYRDDLFGPDFATSVFASEPVNNVVHREVIEPDGVTFTSHRPPDEQKREFLASTDNWFRPTMLKTGPDGALYIADIYRLVIEHPEWIPAETQKHLDLRAGDDKGRIYRVYPANAKLRKVPRLDHLGTAGLVAALDSPNGWQRDTAQRLLVESGNRAAVGPLESLTTENPRPKTRLQALCTLDGLGAVTPELLLRALADEHPAVREHAVRISEQFLRPGVARGPGSLGPLFKALDKLAEDPSIRVRYQLAFSLGEWADERAGRALARLAKADFSNAEMRLAIMSSAKRHAATMLRTLLDAGAGVEVDPKAIEQLTGLVAASDDKPAVVVALRAAVQPIGSSYVSWQLAAIAGLLDTLDRRDVSLQQFQKNAGPELQPTILQFEGLFTQARALVLDPKAPEAVRLYAIRLLGFGLVGHEWTELPQDSALLRQLLEPQYSLALHRAALARLGRFHEPQLGELLLRDWKTYSPDVRTGVLKILFSRPDWVDQLLTALEGKTVAPGEIGTAAQQKLLSYTQSKTRERAEQLFAATSRDRQKVLEAYQGVIELSGHTENGQALFRQNCVLCHQLKGEGNNVGPDLGGMSDKPVDVLLVAILDPNKAVESRYLAYSAVANSGREFSGIMAAETPNSITLRGPGGAEEVILRSDLKQLVGSGLSLMPEGFEKALNPQNLADLIAYIRSR